MPHCSIAGRTAAAGRDNPPMDPWHQRARTVMRHPEFARGGREMVGVALGIGAWGLVTGMAMVRSGLEPWIAVLMSLTVFAGTAQLAVAPLMASGAPIWVVWATALCLNLRFVIFSTQWRPYLAQMPFRRRALMSYFTADLNYVLFMRRFPEPRPAPEQVPYFWGGVLVNAGSWHVLSLVGIALGHRIPPEWGLGFAGTVALLAMTCSLLADRATWLPAIIAGAAAVAAYALPLKLNMLVAIAAAVAVGTIIDHAKPRREVAA
jgi:predicted branched-subunit amino acid permease